MTEREDAQRILKHYFRMLFDEVGMKWQTDYAAELDYVVDSIILAAGSDLATEASVRTASNLQREADQDVSARQAMHDIGTAMDGVEWDADTMNSVAGIVQDYGIVLTPPDRDVVNERLKAEGLPPAPVDTEPARGDTGESRITPLLLAAYTAVREWRTGVMLSAAMAELAKAVDDVLAGKTEA